VLDRPKGYEGMPQARRAGAPEWPLFIDLSTRLPTPQTDRANRPTGRTLQRSSNADDLGVEIHHRPRGHAGSQPGPVRSKRALHAIVCRHPYVYLPRPHPDGPSVFFLRAFGPAGRAVDPLTGLAPWLPTGMRRPASAQVVRMRTTPTAAARTVLHHSGLRRQSRPGARLVPLEINVKRSGNQLPLPVTRPVRLPPCRLCGQQSARRRRRLAALRFTWTRLRLGLYVQDVTVPLHTAQAYRQGHFFIARLLSPLGFRAPADAPSSKARHLRFYLHGYDRTAPRPFQKLHAAAAPRRPATGRSTGRRLLQGGNLRCAVSSSQTAARR